MEQVFLRANSDAQKKIRVQQILNQAIALYDEGGYDKINFARIARSLNFTRNNLYNYFHSKEEIFLEVIQRGTEDLLQDFRDALSSITPGSEKEFIQAWVRVISRHSRLIELYSLMNVDILPYISHDSHSLFQSRQDQMYFQIAKLVKHAIPALSDETAVRFCLYEIHYAMALMPISRRFHQSGVRSDIDPGDFSIVYGQFLETLLEGLKAQERKQHHSDSK